MEKSLSVSIFRRSSAALMLFGMVACGKSAPVAPSTSGSRIIRLSGNLAFGIVPVGQRSAPLTLTIANLGDSPLTVSGMTVPSGNVYLGLEGGTVPAGVAQEVAITFTPTTAQSYNGVLTVNGDQTSGQNTMPISGIGVAADVRLVPGQGSMSCDPAGHCSFSASINNVGSVCASDTAVVARFYNASGTQVGADVPMDATGSLSSKVIRPQDVVQIASTGAVGSEMADAKSYLLFPTWNNLICP